jgi:ABC-type branched-subunit amino acid transport system permease subunit
LQVWLTIVTDYWQLVVGIVVVVLVVAFPQGIVGFGRQQGLAHQSTKQDPRLEGQDP